MVTKRSWNPVLSPILFPTLFSVLKCFLHPFSRVIRTEERVPIPLMDYLLNVVSWPSAAAGDGGMRRGINHRKEIR